MKTQNYQKTIHQHVEQLLRHRAVLILVLCLMFIGVVSFDARLRDLLRGVYAQGLGMIGVYAHHEHTAHRPFELVVSRPAEVTGYK